MLRTKRPALGRVTILTLVLTGACTSGPVSAPAHHGISAERPKPSVASRLASSTRLIQGGNVRCTARLRTPIQAGHQLGLALVLENVTDHPVMVSQRSALIIKAPDGTTYDTRAAAMGAGGPYIPPIKIAPGTAKTLHDPGVAVKWAGPLSVTPICGDSAELPVLQTAVVAQGPAPAEPMAIADVLASSGHLLDRCRPRHDGVPVRGRIDPPSGKTPPMEATCSIKLQHEGNFLVATEMVRIPATLQGVHVKEPYLQVDLPGQSGTAEAVVWVFVVTADGAVPVASTTVARSRGADVMAPDWSWTGSGWQGPGGSRCGGELLSGGGGTDAFIEFVSACPH